MLLVLFGLDISGYRKELFERVFLGWNRIRRKDPLGLSGWIYNDYQWFSLDKLGKEGAHVGDRIELHVGIGCWEIGMDRKGVGPFNHDFFRLHCLKLFSLARVPNYFERGVSSLGGHHGGITRVGHRPTRKHVEFLQEK